MTCDRDNVLECKQGEFDSELRKMIREEQNEGQQLCKMVRRHLHNLVAKESWINRLPDDMQSNVKIIGKSYNNGCENCDYLFCVRYRLIEEM